MFVDIKEERKELLIEVICSLLALVLVSASLLQKDRNPIFLYDKYWCFAAFIVILFITYNSFIEYYQERYK